MAVCCCVELSNLWPYDTYMHEHFDFFLLYCCIMAYITDYSAAHIFQCLVSSIQFLLLVAGGLVSSSKYEVGTFRLGGARKDWKFLAYFWWDD